MFLSFDTPSGGKGLVALDAIVAIAEDKSVLSGGGSVVMLRNNETVTTLPGRDSWAKAILESLRSAEAKNVIEVRR